MIFKALVVAGVTWVVTEMLMRSWAAMRDDEIAIEILRGPTDFVARHKLISVLALLNIASLYAMVGTLTFMVASYLWSLGA